MITLQASTVEAIRIEMESIPEKYQKPFNSVHEGLAVLREEYVELENEIFFGEKRAKEHSYTNEPGVRDRGFHQTEGFLYRETRLIPIPEEMLYFKTLGIPYIQPENRNADSFRK